MPEYEYRCPECGERFSRVRPLREASEPAECPRCGAAARRILSAVSVARGACAPAGGG